MAAGCTKGPDMDVARLDHRALSRIAAMLFGLALLAERAGSRSFPVRWLVLSILRRAEAVARAFVVEAMQAQWPCFEEPLEIDNRPVDAVWLAWRFRVLAAMLGALLRLASRLNGCNAGIDRAPRRLAPGPVLRVCGGWRRNLYDTS